MPEYKSPQSEPGTEQRFLLMALLMAVIIFGSQILVRKYGPQPVQQPARPPQTQPAITRPGAAAPAGAPSPAATLASAKQASAETETVVENELYRIVFTNRGAQAKSWTLKKYSDDRGQPLDLVNAAASTKYGYPLSLWTYDEALRTKLNQALYVSSAAGLVRAPASLVFEYAESGLTVRKELHFDHSYVVGLETSVSINGTPGYVFPAWPAGFGDQTSLGSYAGAQLEYQVNNDTQYLSPKKVSGGATLHGTYNWAGASSTYFAAVFIPDSTENVDVITLHNTLEVASDPAHPDQTKPADVLGIALGRSGSFAGRLFVGPKSLEVLDSVPVPTLVGAKKDLRALVNFGWYGLIARPLFIWLRWTNDYVHNWGWSIVLQTLIITLALVPFRYYQMKSGLKMQRVQPQMKAIQEKYKKYSMRDPRKQEMQREIAELYKREGVNPLGGCLPMLIQLPFLIAYYRMLGATIDLRQAHWLWIHDLSARDPYFLLPGIMVLSMFVMQKMTPQAGMDPAQQRMMNVMMPIMMGVIFYNLAAGLNLYYAESNLIMIAQTAIMNRTELGREMRELAAKRARKKARS